MKFVIVAVLLATVVGTYGQSVNAGAKAGANAAIGGGNNAADAAGPGALNAVLTRILGPKLALTVSKLILALKKVPLIRPVIRLVLKPLIALLKKAGGVDKLVSGGDTNAPNKATQANGKPTNLPPAQQKELETILERTLGRYTAPYVVELCALLADGRIAGKLPLNKILRFVIRLLHTLAAPGALVGKLIGPHGLGKLLRGLLSGGKGHGLLGLNL